MKWIFPQTLKNKELTKLTVKTHQMCLLAQLQKETLLDYKETSVKSIKHKELSQYVWEDMHTTFPITSTSAIVSKLTTREDGEVIEPSIFRQVETLDLGPPKVKGLEDSSSEQEDETQQQDQFKMELTLVARCSAIL